MKKFISYYSIEIVITIIIAAIATFIILKNNQIENDEKIEWENYKKRHLCKLVEINSIKNENKWSCDGFTLINRLGD